jgi:hypothetical protein
MLLKWGHPMNKPKYSINKLIAKANQKKTYLVIFGGILVLGVLLLFVVVHQYKTPQKKVRTHKPIQFITTTKIAEFGRSAIGTALENVQSNEDGLQHKLKQDLAQQAVSTKSTQSKVTQLETTLENLQNEMSVMKIAQQQAVKAEEKRRIASHLQVKMLPNQRGAIDGQTPSSKPAHPSKVVADFSFRYKDPGKVSNSICTPKNCVLPGTFAQAVLLGAADANASVNGEANTTPILFRILNEGTLPNGYHSSLRGCFVVGEVYGDISSERGEVKLSTISCIKHGKTITRNINGTAYDIGGKEGIRGNPVMRNGKLLAYAGGSGFLSGIGSAIQQQYTTNSISPLGNTSTVDNGRVFQAGAANGAETALSKLSEYYIKRADQYHPIIQINAGSRVDLVFLNQFSLTPQKGRMQSSSGASVTKHLSNHFWSGFSSGGLVQKRQDLSNLHFSDAVSKTNVSHIQSQMNAISNEVNHG